MVNQPGNLDPFLEKINNTDFQQNTISFSKNRFNVEKKSFSILGRSVKPEKLNKAVQSFRENVLTQMETLNQDTLAQATSKLETHIIEVSKNTNAYTPAIVSISKLMHEIAIFKWNHTDKPMKEVVEDLKLDKVHKKELKQDYIDKEGELFVSDNVLCISKSFIENNSDKEIKRKLENALQDHSGINLIQVQGASDTISLDSLKYILQQKDHPCSTFLLSLTQPFKIKFYPGKKSVAGDEPQILDVNPSLMASSVYFATSANFQKKAGSSDEVFELNKPSKDVASVPISLSTMKLINQDIHSIEITERNIHELLHAADYFIIPELLKRCDQFLCDRFKQIPDYEATKEGMKLYDLAHQYDLIALEQLLTKYFTDTKDIHLLMSNLSLMSQNKIFITELDLSRMQTVTYKGVKTGKKPVTDRRLQAILKHQPHITSLKLNGCTGLTLNFISPDLKIEHLEMRNCRLTDEVGPNLAKLKHLKQLDLTNPHSVGKNKFSHKLLENLRGLRNLKKLTVSTADITLTPELAKKLGIKK